MCFNFYFSFICTTVTFELIQVFIFGWKFLCNNYKYIFYNDINFFHPLLQTHLTILHFFFALYCFIRKYFYFPRLMRLLSLLHCFVIFFSSDYMVLWNFLISFSSLNISPQNSITVHFSFILNVFLHINNIFTIIPVSSSFSFLYQLISPSKSFIPFSYFNFHFSSFTSIKFRNKSRIYEGESESERKLVRPP